jgi:hypothetical protein
MTRVAAEPPYRLAMVDGGYTVTEPVTGLRVEDAHLTRGMGRMHRLLIDRRDELAARDPATLSAEERRDLEHLRSYPDAFLQHGLQLGRDAA